MSPNVLETDSKTTNVGVQRGCSLQQHGLFSLWVFVFVGSLTNLVVHPCSPFCRLFQARWIVTPNTSGAGVCSFLVQIAIQSTLVSCIALRTCIASAIVTRVTRDCEYARRWGVVGPKINSVDWQISYVVQKFRGTIKQGNLIFEYMVCSLLSPLFQNGPRKVVISVIS